MDKLVLGIPFYGRGSKKMKGFTNFKHLVNQTEYERKWDDKAKAPYLVDSEGEFICSYEDAESIAYKCQFILEKGMLGAMYWDYDGDDSEGTLRKAVYNGLNK